MTQSDIAISAQGLGKSYKIGHRSETGRSETLRDAMVKGVSNFARKTGDVLRGRPLIAGDTIEEFWALKDVSFEVKRGEAVGIIGHNGAGKSTLLKVLSRITEPSSGKVEIRGRLSSLLEVGTGFHAELSGRENIFLNGAVLGMRRSQVQRKFDEIVSFAGVEKFLDTPVKRYSSGMYVRLAFSVAAHLEPEIMVVDEVLAVGDTEFQKKCVKKMGDVAGQGSTVIFVSHNLGLIETLCNKGLVLNRGSLKFAGDVREAADFYLKSTTALSHSTAKLNDRHNDSIELWNMSARESGADTVGACRSGGKAEINLHIRNTTSDPVDKVNLAVGIKGANGQLLTMLESRLVGSYFTLQPGDNEIRFTLGKLPLSAGTYSLSLRMDAGGVFLCRATDAGSIRVEGGSFFQNGGVPPAHLNIALTDFDVKQV